MLRRSPRVFVLRLAAVTVAFATAWFVAGDLAALHRRARGLGSEVGAVVATHDLMLGATVASGDLRVRRVFRSQLPPGTVTSPGRLMGRTIAVPLLRGQYVSTRHLAHSHRSGIDGLVPTGMRAVRIDATGTLRPRAGAVVDLIATFDASSGRPTTITVASGVLVLASDAHTTGASTPTVGVTLLVTPDEAEDVAGAAATAVVTLALAPPESSTQR